MKDKDFECKDGYFRAWSIRKEQECYYVKVPQRCAIFPIQSSKEEEDLRQDPHKISGLHAYPGDITIPLCPQLFLPSFFKFLLLDISELCGVKKNPKMNTFEHAMPM